MGWSEEVHARRTLDIREVRRQQRAAGPYAVPELKGNASLLSVVAVTGALAARAAWQREGRYLRSRDIRRIPFVGAWLAEHMPQWRDNSPRRKAGSAAARRAARLSQAQATAHSAASTSTQHALTGSTAESTPASTGRADAEQQVASSAAPRKQRNRKRSKRR